MDTVRDDLLYFKFSYGVLIEHYFSVKVNLLDKFDQDILMLLSLTREYGCSIDTFLVSNCISYDDFDLFKFPFVRFLLHNTAISFGRYERYHKVHGDSPSAINYTNFFKLQQEVDDALYISSKLNFRLPDMLGLFNTLPRVLQVYLFTKYKDSVFKNSPPVLKFKLNTYKNRVMKVMPESVFFGKFSKLELEV